MICVLNCVDGLLDINGCELLRGCMFGVGLNFRCCMYFLELFVCGRMNYII